MREARERVQAAILNSGYEFPPRRITANLAPADVPKAGPGLDLALACAVLAASGQLAARALESVALFGELALDGAVRPARARWRWPRRRARPGCARWSSRARAPARRSSIEGLEVVVVERLQSAVRVSRAAAATRCPSAAGARSRRANAPGTGPDLSEVRGQHHAVQGARDRRGGRAQHAC